MLSALCAMLWVIGVELVAGSQCPESCKQEPRPAKLVGHFLEQQMIRKDSDADRNRAIGNIERRPVVPADIKIEEIRDHTKPDPVNEVAYGAAKDQRKTYCQPGLRPGRLQVKV